MLRYALVISLILCSGSSVNAQTLPTAPGMDYSNLIETSKRSLVRVYAVQKNGGQIAYALLGTGFVVNRDGDIATAGHVVDKITSPTQIMVVPEVEIQADIQKNQAKVIARDSDHDLTILHSSYIKDKNIPPIALGEKIQLGNFAIFMGFPLDDPSITCGLAMIGGRTEKSLAKGAKPTSLLKIDGSINKGHSGGPLLSADTGKIVGILDAKAGALADRLKIFSQTPPSASISIGGNDPIELLQKTIIDLENITQLGIGYAVPVEHLIALLKKEKIKYET